MWSISITCSQKYYCHCHSFQAFQRPGEKVTFFFWKCLLFCGMYLFWHVFYQNQKQMWNTWLNSKIFTITFYTQAHLSDSTEIKFIFLFYFSRFNYPVAKGNLFEVDNSEKLINLFVQQNQWVFWVTLFIFKLLSTMKTSSGNILW